MDDISPLQRNIMFFVGVWVRQKKTPVPYREIVIKLEEAGVKTFTIDLALQRLLHKGYMRKAIMPGNRKKYYVMLRTV